MALEYFRLPTREGRLLKRTTWHWVLLVAVLLSGVVARTYRPITVPAGFDQDEISEAYESYSLLKTGADRWGYHLPVYFVGWGSGQNVLQAYATVPVIALFGLSGFSVRFFDLACGLLTLPLFYLVCRRNFGEHAALLSTLFLALSPWHIMVSRWAVECNSLPFFVLLGIFCFQEALERRSALLTAICLIPFAIAFYVYGIMLVVVPSLMLLLLVKEFRRIKADWHVWAVGVAVFLAISGPFSFFVWKNYLVKRSYGFERYLPISVPLMPINRLHQLMKHESPLSQNFHFLTHALQDHTTWSQVKLSPPIPLTVLAMAAVGIFLTVSRAIRSRKIPNPLVLWLVASLPVFLIVPIQINEAINVYAPLLALAGAGAMALWYKLRNARLRPVVVAVFWCLFAFETGWFLTSYFGKRYAAQSAPDFHPEAKEVLARLQSIAHPEDSIFLCNLLRLNYVYVLYYNQIDPKQFQDAHATYLNPDFAQYVFTRKRLAQRGGPVTYAIYRGETPMCENPSEVKVIGMFETGRCLEPLPFIGPETSVFD
jgi:hypothetical protein